MFAVRNELEPITDLLVVAAWWCWVGGWGGALRAGEACPRLFHCHWTLPEEWAVVPKGRRFLKHPQRLVHAFLIHCQQLEVLPQGQDVANNCQVWGKAEKEAHCDCELWLWTGEPPPRRGKTRDRQQDSPVAPDEMWSEGRVCSSASLELEKGDVRRRVGGDVWAGV